MVVHCRSSSAGARRTAERVHAAGVEALLVRGDIVSWEDIKRMATTVDAGLGGLDVLVNNVGDMASEQASWQEITEELIDHTLAVDIKGTMLMIHEFGTRMLEREGDAIVNIGSTVIVRPPRAPQYAAGKYGVVGLTKSCAKAFAPHVRVNTFAPGSCAPSVCSTEPTGRPVAVSNSLATRPGDGSRARGARRHGAVPRLRRGRPHHGQLHDLRWWLQHAGGVV